MANIWQSLRAQSPWLWVLLVLAAVLTYGAKKLASAVKDEEKQKKLILIFKIAGLALAIAAFIVAFV